MNKIYQVCGAILVLGAAFPAAGFGTINRLGQHAEHERITRLALKTADIGPDTLDELAGKSGSFGAVGAPDRPDRGLLFESKAHCDNADHLDVPGYPQSAATAQGRLDACRQWIRGNLDAAVADAGPLVGTDLKINTSLASTQFGCVYDGHKGRAKCNVLEDLGLAFHAAQDFYSHSNWVDRPAEGATGPANPPGLGHAGRSPWLDPRRETAFPRGLMTGCFEKFPESLPGSCTYGDGQVRVKHAVLNKDDGVIDVATGVIHEGMTARGSVHGNFAAAVHAAVDDTRDKWSYFADRLRQTYGDARGTRMLCVIRSDSPAGC